jgi:serine protease AprX
MIRARRPRNAAAPHTLKELLMARVRLRNAGVAVVTAATLLYPGTAFAATTTTPAISDYTYTATAATMADVRRIIRADVAHAAGYTGKGVGVALIDTGVVPVAGLTAGNVANGPDLSLESQVPGLTRRDTYGHGTHMAGIIAGRDAAGGSFRGVAPDAKLLSIKVGAANGAVDVTQVMAAVDWVVAHRNDDPAYPIKVLNLSYGTDSTQSWATSPLSHAVQNAYLAGITVVIASGNTGANILNPGGNPYIVTVGATDPRGTTSPADDVVASFSSQGNGTTNAPDVMAPGRSIVSLRDPGSYADVNYPAARVGDRFFKGSGTSQAAAVVSGAAAVLLQKHPSASPMQVMCFLRASGSAVTGSNVPQINLQSAIRSTLTSCNQSGTTPTGKGSIQSDRGSSEVTFGDSTKLTGERDIFGPLSSATWAAASTARTSWNGGDWMGRPWTGTGWVASSDGQPNWAGRAWSGRAWSGRAWSEVAWAGQTWSGRAWSSSTGSGPTWTGAGWSANGWLSAGDKGWMF